MNVSWKLTDDTYKSLRFSKQPDMILGLSLVSLMHSIVRKSESSDSQSEPSQGLRSGSADTKSISDDSNQIIASF